MMASPLKALDEIKSIVAAAPIFATYSPDFRNVRVVPYEVAHGSTASIFKVITPVELFVKDQHSKRGGEQQGFSSLNESPSFGSHLLPAWVEDRSQRFWVTQFVQSRTLNDLVIEANGVDEVEEFILHLFRDFCRAELMLWMETQTDTEADLARLYRARVLAPDRLEALDRELQRCFNVPGILETSVTINGTSFDRFGEIVDQFFARVSKTSAPFGRTIHGDDQPRNILIPESTIGNDFRSWKVVDYTTVQRGADWMVSIAKMLHWWDFYFAIEQVAAHSTLRQSLRTVAEYEPRRKIFHISFDESALSALRPPVATSLYLETLRLAASAAQILEPDPTRWRVRLSQALFAVVFGSAYRHTDRMGFALPIMIAKSLTYLTSGMCDTDGEDAFGLNLASQSGTEERRSIRREMPVIGNA
jgi:hypothetical protein